MGRTGAVGPGLCLSGQRVPSVLVLVSEAQPQGPPTATVASMGRVDSGHLYSPFPGPDWALQISGVPGGPGMHLGPGPCTHQLGESQSCSPGTNFPGNSFQVCILDPQRGQAVSMAPRQQTEATLPSHPMPSHPTPALGDPRDPDTAGNDDTKRQMAWGMTENLPKWSLEVTSSDRTGCKARLGDRPLVLRCSRWG